MQLINQYSAVWALILPLGLLVTAVRLRRQPVISRLIGGAGLVLLVYIGYFLIQPEANPVPVNEVEAMLAAPSGRPIFLELYSDY